MVVSPYVDFGPCIVPFSLDTLQALRAHWHLPYSYVPSLGAGPDISMSFSPLLGDKDWKGELTPTDCQLQHLKLPTIRLPHRSSILTKMFRVCP